MSGGFTQKILLLLDNETDEATAMHILNKYNFANRVETLRNFSKARAYAASFSGSRDPGEIPEMILLFHSSSPQRQMDLARKARENPELRNIPLVVVVDSPETEKEYRAANLPRTHCVRQPLGFFKLLEALQKLEMRWLILNRADPA